MQPIKQAVTILRQGGLVAFPTETVYGLGADARNPEAVRKVFRAKGRPEDHPVIVHLAQVAQLVDWAMAIPPAVYELAAAFWPGPLTLVLKRQPHVLDIVTGQQETVAIRVPHHPLAQALLQAFGDGMVAPSANRFTHLSPTTAAAVKEELAEKVDFILDGGACQVGLESTILDMSNDKPQLLRPGMISIEMLEAVLKRQVAPQATTAIRVPGRHEKHYSPSTKTMLLSKVEIPTALKELAPNTVIVAHSSFLQLPTSTTIKQMPADPKLYAQQIYDVLRQLDHQAWQQIIIEAVPADNTWDAIRDRLSKMR